MATVPKTVKTYNLNGSLKDFAVNFEYLARKFVVVTLLGATRKELVINVDYRFTTPTQITTTLAEGPGTGYDLIEIRRVTSATDRLVDFADGSILRAYDLNTSQIQSLHIAEEARDLTADVIAINAEGQLDARGKKIQNLSDGTAPGDAVTLRQNQTWAQSTLGNRNAAEAAANLAVASRDTASNAQSVATTQAGIATTKATESEASAVRSENAAGTIGNNVALAQTARSGAENARDQSVAAAVSVQGVNIPSAVGNALKWLRQKANESGFEYVEAYTKAAIDALLGALLPKSTYDADVSFTIIYPNGGSAASPALITSGARYVSSNPFPGSHVMCEAEVLYSGKWGRAGWSSIYSSAWYVRGTSANQLGDTIVTQAGLNGVTGYSAATGSPFGFNDSTFPASLPVRVRVWKVKGGVA